MKVPPDALWIGPGHPFDLHECYFEFRRTLTLDRPVEQATLWITADSRYRLWINGAYVAFGPSRCWPHAQQVDKINVMQLLRTGKNVIDIQIYSPGYSHFAYVHRGTCGLLAWLECDGEFACATDQDWQVRRDHTWRDDVKRVSIYGSGVERRDLRIGPGEWVPARVIAGSDGPLWRGLSPRDVPMLREIEVILDRPRRTRLCGPLQHDDPHEALRAAWVSGEDVQPPEQVVLEAGKSLLWAFDLGASCVCRGSATIAGAAGGERLLISYAEKLRDGDLLISDPRTYCRMRPTDEFILQPGDQVVGGFSQRGGRYIIFAIEALWDIELTIAFAAHISNYPVSPKETFHSDPDLDRIALMCQRTLLSCLQDGFADSVWREGSQWLGDCVPEALALSAVSDDQRPLRRAITMAAAGAYDDGVLPSVLPGEVHAYTIVDYNFSWIELLAMYRDGDRARLHAGMRPVLEKMLDRFAADLRSDGLIYSQPGRRFFIDWSPVDRREPNLTYNARYLHALNLAVSLGIAGCEARAVALRAAIRKAFNDGNVWHENDSGVPASQLGLSFLLLTGLAGQEVADKIVARSLDLDDGHTPEKLVLASPFMHHYVFLALDRIGRHDDILAIIRARWGRWAEAGEPTTWENWNVDFPDGSKCHGFAAHPLYWIARHQPVT
jgi:hypothetical protein